MLNRVSLIGTIQKPAEDKVFGTITATVAILETKQEWTHPQNKEKVTRSMFHTLCFVGKTAEIAKKIAKQGRLFHVEGSLTYRKLKNKEGGDYVRAEVLVDALHIIPTAKPKSNKPKEKHSPNGNTFNSGEKAVKSFKGKPIFNNSTQNKPPQPKIQVFKNEHTLYQQHGNVAYIPNKK